MSSFPRLYAAASLKLRPRRRVPPLGVPFSAALCRGLIEAMGGSDMANLTAARFPRLYAAASLKRVESILSIPKVARVFRGSMPRPH